MDILENRLKINHLSVHLRKIYIYIYKEQIQGKQKKKTRIRAEINREN